MPPKAKLDPRDFLFEDGWFEELYRKPQQLHQQQFQLSDLEECRVGLFDSSACVYIDECKYSWVFIGPCESTVFLRDCTGVTVVCACQQFRARNCRDCRVALFCESQPIIESSHHLQIACYPQWACYDQIVAHAHNSRLNLWANRWFDVYDFTPKHQNWKKGNLLETDHQIFQTMLAKNNLQNSKSLHFPQCEGTNPTNNQPQLLTIIIFQNKCPTLNHLPLFIESRIAKLNRQLQILLDLKPNNTQQLFVKIKKQQTKHWSGISGVVCVVQEAKKIEAIQNIVFVPFKDQR